MLLCPIYELGFCFPGEMRIARMEVMGKGKEVESIREYLEGCEMYLLCVCVCVCGLQGVDGEPQRIRKRRERREKKLERN